MEGHHQSVLPKGRSFTANVGTKVAVLSKGRSSTANSGTKDICSSVQRQVFHRKLRNQVSSITRDKQVLQFPVAFRTPFSLQHPNRPLNIRKYPRGYNVEVRRVDLVNGPSGLYRNSPQELNISSIRVFDQGQVLHCKLRHQGCNSAQRQIFNCKLRNLGCNFTRDEQVLQLPVAFRTALSLQDLNKP